MPRSTSRHPEEAAHQQPGGKQQHERERDLSHHESPAQAAAPEAGRDAAAPLLEAAHEVATGAVQRRQQAEEERREQRHREAEGQHRPVERDLDLVSDPLARQHLEQRTQQAPGDQAAGRPAGERQDRALHQELPHDPAAARPERRADRHLALARRCPREQHVRDVDAGDHQQQRHRTEERVEHAAEAAYHPVDHGDHRDAEPLRVVRRVLARAALGDHRELGRGLLDADAGPQVRLEPAPRRGRVGRGAALDRLRHPRVGDVPGEARRHHADHGVAGVVQHDATADHREVSTEVPLPGRVTQHGDRRRTRERVRAAEGPAEQRLDAQELEDVGRRPGDAHRLGPFRLAQHHALGGRSDDGVERAALLLEVHELVGKQLPAVEPFRAVHVAHHHVHHPARARIGEGIEQDVVEHAVHHRDRADAEAERQHRHRREATVARKLAQAIANVLPQRVQDSGAVHEVDNDPKGLSLRRSPGRASRRRRPSPSSRGPAGSGCPRRSGTRSRSG